jgi:hypothetical protein
LFCSPHHSDSALYPFVTRSSVPPVCNPATRSEAKLDKLEVALRYADGGSGEAIGLFAELLDLPDTGRYPRSTLDPQQRR